MEAAKDLQSRLLWHTANIYLFIYSQKNLAKPHSQISNKYLQNRITTFLPVFFYSGENCSTRCSDSAVRIGEKIFPKIIMKVPK
jgi:hypothetical protein